MSSIYNEARRLYLLNFATLWLHPKSKRPVESGWTSGDRKPWLYLKSTYQEGMNLGVRTGTPSKTDRGYLAVIDVDIKKPGTETLKAATAVVRKLLGDAIKTCPKVRSGSGNGAAHYYCVTKEPFKMITAEKNADFEVCVYSDGRQMVLPPSVHPDTGKEYKWERELVLENLPLIDFSGVESKSSAPKDKKKKNLDAPEVVIQDFEAVEVDLAWLPISDKIREGILHGTDVADRSGFLLPATSALHSAGLSENEILSVLTDPSTFLGACAYDHAKTKNRKRAAHWVRRYTLDKIKEERDPTAVFANLCDVVVTPLSDTEREEFEKDFAEKNWRHQLVRTAKGKTAVTLKNLDLIFSNEVDGNLFIKDLFANRIAYGVDAPWSRSKDQYLEDIDMILVKRWLADTTFRIEPPTNAIMEATTLVAHRMAVHPVREWLSGLKWDGVSRVSTWIKDYCQGSAPEPYLSEVSRKFLLAMVKRVFEPGCQWDYVLVLEGDQGRYKSSIARALASDKWFMDNLPDLKDKDAMLNLQGKWLIELGELANVKRSDYNLVKAYLIRRFDTVRPHYGRIMADVPRQSVFIGTVNEGQYLKDPTGNRRYWPVRVETCDVPGLKAVRDQLFAEAVHIYKTTNEVLMLTPAGTAQALDAQEDRRVDDDESEMREAFMTFRESAAGQEFDFDKFKVHDLFTGANAPWGRFANRPYANQTAGQVLRNMGFERRKVMGQRIWGTPENAGLRWEKYVSQAGMPKRGVDRGIAKRSAPVDDDEIDFM